MNSRKGKILLLAGGIVALIAIAIFFIVDVNTFKSKIESAASDATGLQVRIKGRMELSFAPFGISALDVRVAGKNGEVVTLERLKLGAELRPLLHKRLVVTSCELVRPIVTITENTDGSYNFQSAGKKRVPGSPGVTVSLRDLKLSKGVFVYQDASGAKTALQDVNLTLREFSAPGDSLRDISFAGSFDCREVQRKEFRVVDVKSTVKADKGVYTFEPLSLGTFEYLDRKTGAKTSMRGVDLAIRGLSFTGAAANAMQGVSCTGTLACKEVRKGAFSITAIRSLFRVAKGSLRLAPLTLEVFGAQGEGDVAVDMSRTDAVYRINMKIAKLDFAKLQESFGTKRFVAGRADLHASLTIREKGARNLLRGMDGTLLLRGNDLVIYSLDLDKVLSSFESSQSFDLVDLGAFFIAGPLSNIVLKGYRYGDLYYQTRGGQSAVTQFVSSWRIKGGMADAVDCALATRSNRIALKGRLDLVGKRYDNVVVGVLDSKGCVKFKQSITGTFDNPHVSTVSIVESLTGPFINLFRKAKRFVGACEIFYNGSVRHPGQ